MQSRARPRTVYARSVAAETGTSAHRGKCFQPDHGAIRRGWMSTTTVDPDVKSRTAKMEDMASVEGTEMVDAEGSEGMIGGMAVGRAGDHEVRRIR